MEVPVPTIEAAGLEEAEGLLLEREVLKQAKKDLEAKIFSIDEVLGKAFDEKDIRSAVWKNYLVIRRSGSKPRPSLDRVLLLEAGVTPQQLKAGTKYSDPGRPGITVRPISEARAAGFEESYSE